MTWPGGGTVFEALRRALPEPFFQTQAFLLFAAIVFAVYWMIPRRFNTARVVVLVLASLVFYAAWNADLAFLVLATSTIDYLLARMMDARIGRIRRLMLIASIGMNLGLLAYFKYRGFFLNELHSLLTALGMPPGYDKLDLLNLLIPFGISFYTFEAVSYAVDVYTRRIKAERSLPHFLLFILFFPHLVAGPIVRAGDFLRQTQRVKRWNWLRARAGLELFVLGLVKKFAIADRMAVFADPVFADPQSYSSAANWLAVLAFSLRIYADFSAYSDMARGLAHFFGYRLAVNFNAPYLAPNIAEFWRRWHISLSTWLRDYIFIPLGGSRGSPWLTARNLIIVMTLGGLWHGANWTYLFWGLYHGLLLVLHRIWKSNVNVKVNNHIINNIYILLSTLFTFILVSIGWVLFQPDGGKCLAMISQLLAFHGGLPLDPHPRSLWWTALAMLLATAFFATWRKWLQTMPPALAGGTLALAVCLAQVLAPNGEKVFIYFTF